MGSVVLACRVLTGLVFLAAVAGKARDVPGFVKSVRDLAFVPSPLAGPAAWATLAAEGAAVVLLALPRTAAWGFAVALVLDLAFTAVIAVVLARGISVSCHCFGTTPRRFGLRHLVRDGVLTAAAALGAVGTLGGAAPARITGPAGLAAAGAGVFGAVLVVLADTIAELFLVDSPS